MFDTTIRSLAKQNVIRNTLLILVMALLVVGCTPPKIAPTEALDLLTAAYDHPTFDPSAAAWEELVTHPAYAKDEIVFLEIMALNGTDDALEQVNAYVDALTPAIEEAGGELIYVYDILSEGTGDLLELHGEMYRGGVAYSVRFPSRAALVETMLSQPVVEAHTQRNAAVAAVQMMLGTDKLPAAAAKILKDTDAATLSTPFIDRKTPAQLLDELKSIYPDGGADSTREQLERLLNLKGYANQPVYYLNLYDWGSYGEAGAETHDAYNQAAQKDVSAHGVNVSARVDIEQNLVGPYDWDRLVLPRWSSFAVFTNLRLKPSYVEAQRFRVDSADIYGNYITIAR